VALAVAGVHEMIAPRGGTTNNRCDGQSGTTSPSPWDRLGRFRLRGLN
jgi:hypothetical protein